MSSTESHESTEARALAFYQEVVVPTALALQARSREFFPLTWDDAPSFFNPYSASPEHELADLEVSAEALRRMWHVDPELVAIAERLVAFAHEVRPATTESSEVSPFVYVMF